MIYLELDVAISSIYIFSSQIYLSLLSSFAITCYNAYNVILIHAISSSRRDIVETTTDPWWKIEIVLIEFRVT